MFEVGDFIVHGGNGVCKVVNVGVPEGLHLSKKREYYTLEPYYSNGSTVFTPVDNEKVVMRPVIDKEEAMQLIGEMSSIEILWIADEKKREATYKESLRSCDCREMVKIIKTIYSRKLDRMAAGKKVTALDERFFHMTEDSLYGELAVSLGMDKDQVRDFVVEKVQDLVEV